MLEPKPNKKQNTQPPKAKKSSKQFKSSVRSSPHPPSRCSIFSMQETVPTSDIEEDMEVNGHGDTSAELEKPPAAQSGESAKVCFATPKLRIPPANGSKKNKVMSAKPPKKSNPPKASGSRTKPSPRPSTASTPEAPVDVSGSQHQLCQYSPLQRAIPNCPSLMMNPRRKRN
jgi:hypothetical protein